MSKILLVDEDERSRTKVQGYLRTKGFEVVAAEGGQEGLSAYERERPDAVVLSRSLPDLDGFSVCRALRSHPAAGAKVAVMFVGEGELPERIAAFESGADDFVPRPTALEEIFARMQALLRRANGAQGDQLFADDLKMDRIRHRVTRTGEEIPLTLTEFNLLEYLLRHKNVALTRKAILEAVWGGNVDGFTNIVDVYVNYLRKKIEREGRKKLLKTVRGVGYMLED